MSLSNGILSSSPTFSLFVHHRSQPKRKAQSNKNRVNPKAFSHPQIWKESLDFYMYEILSDSGKNVPTVFLVPSIEIFGANSSRSWGRPRNSKWKIENSSWVLKQKRPDPSPFILKENQVPDSNWDANRFVEVCTELSSLTPEMMPTDTTSPPFLNRSKFLPVNCHSVRRCLKLGLSLDAPICFFFLQCLRSAAIKAHEEQEGRRSRSPHSPTGGRRSEFSGTRRYPEDGAYIQRSCTAQEPRYPADNGG